LTVSVIIPNYNHGNYLEQRINSILNQSYKDYEIIILDDFSTDQSKEIIESYRNNIKVSHVVYNTENCGSPFNQWQKGFEYATGELIWIAESDDFASNTFLEKLVSNLKKSKDIVLSYTGTINVDSQNSIVGENTWASELDFNRWKNDFTTDKKNKIYPYLAFRNIIPNASAVLFKKSAINDFDFNNINKLKYTGDWVFWIHIFSKGEIAFNSEFLNFQRHHSASTTSKKSLSNEIIRIKEYLLCIKYYNKLYNSSTSFFDNRYDWIFNQIKSNIPFNIRTIGALSAFSNSFSFSSRLLITYFK